MLALAACWPLAARAQSYSFRPIKMILPFPAGSSTNETARFIAEGMRKVFGRAVFIENKAGADDCMVAQNAKRALPDGYTLFMSTNSTYAVNKTLYSKLTYSPEKDFESVADQRAATKPLSLGAGKATSNSPAFRRSEHTRRNSQ